MNKICIFLKMPKKILFWAFQMILGNFDFSPKLLLVLILLGDNQLWYWLTKRQRIRNNTKYTFSRN